MRSLKQLVKWCMRLVARGLGTTAAGLYLRDEICRATVAETQKVSGGAWHYSFSTPNGLCRWRAETFSTKEPETLEWIDSFPEGSILWDVGANVGLYSIYAAQERGCRVWAFEPSVFNLECLARNTWLNSATSRICIVPIALSDTSGSSLLHMSSTEWGGALSSFDKDYGHDGNKLEEIFRFRTFGCSMDEALNLLRIPQPDYVKLDVDGIEHLILKGGREVLASVKGVLIEINEDFQEQADGCVLALEEAGLVFKEKRTSEVILAQSQFSHTYNHIWIRP
jgi:FkbM family methyltransferase